jgi:hypothetical protein
MSVDLDELFDAMRRQADTVALPGAGPARERGRHRNRMRATMTVAVVVMLVAVGTGLAVRGPSARHDWAAMPTVGSPLLLDGVPTDARVVTDGTRAYVAWIRPDNDSVWVAAIDLRTGAVAWKPQRLSQPGASEALEQVLVTPSAVVVVTKPRVDPPNGFMFYLLDRRGGGLTDALAGDDDDLGGSDQGKEDWVFAGDQMVTIDPTGGQVLFNGVAGAGYSGYTSGNTAYTRLLGWGTTTDEKSVSQSGRSAAFTDSRVALLTVDGTADVFDAGTGKKLRTVRLGLVTGKQMAVFDGTLSMVDPHDSPTGPQRLRFVDLSGGNGGAWETAPMPGAVVAMSECGPVRVCVVTSAAGRKDLITAFDVRQRRVAWQATTEVTGAAQLSAANGRTLVAGTGGFDLYDPDGGRIATGSSAFHGVWLDPQQLLVMHPDGVLARLPIGDREPKPIGRAPTGTLGCTSTSTRLTCVAATTVTTWDVS